LWGQCTQLLGEIILSIKLRSATIADAPKLAEMNQHLIIDENSRNRMSLEELTDRMRGWMLEGRSVIIVERHEAIIGYLVYYTNKEKYYPYTNNVYVRQYFIDASYRRRGVGQVAFEQITRDYFPDNAIVMLDVLQSNPEGQAFWMKLGFETYCTTLRREI